MSLMATRVLDFLFNHNMNHKQFVKLHENLDTVTGGYLVSEDFRQELLAESIEKFDKFGVNKMLNLACHKVMRQFQMAHVEARQQCFGLHFEVIRSIYEGANSAYAQAEFEAGSDEGVSSGLPGVLQSVKVAVCQSTDTVRCLCGYASCKIPKWQRWSQAANKKLKEPVKVQFLSVISEMEKIANGNSPNSDRNSCSLRPTEKATITKSVRLG